MRYNFIYLAIAAVVVTACTGNVKTDGKEVPIKDVLTTAASCGLFEVGRDIIIRIWGTFPSPTVSRVGDALCAKVAIQPEVQSTAAGTQAPVSFEVNGVQVRGVYRP